MPSDVYPSLPGWIEDSYLSLERYLCEQTDKDSFTQQQATDLIAESNPNFGDADINHALEYLLNRGWLYQVDDQLFITDLQCGEEE